MPQKFFPLPAPSKVCVSLRRSPRAKRKYASPEDSRREMARRITWSLPVAATASWVPPRRRRTEQGFGLNIRAFEQRANPSSKAIPS